MIIVLQIAVVLAQLYVMMALIKITKAKIRVEGRLDEVLDERDALLDKRNELWDERNDLWSKRDDLRQRVKVITTERDALQKASIPLLEAMFNLRDGHYIVDEQKVFPLNAALSGCKNIAEQMAQFSIWKDVPDDDEETGEEADDEA